MLNTLKKILPDTFKKKINLLLHKGNNYECPFCGYSSKDLQLTGLSFPVLKEKQVVGAGIRYGGCFSCSSNDRERLIYTYLKEVKKIFAAKNLKILHIAPEKNLSKKILAFGFEDYVCADLFTEGYVYPSHVKNINVMNIPYPDNTFDIVICNHVLEHIDMDLKAMKEILRVLKTGGEAILQVPISKNSQATYEDFSITDPSKRELAFGQFDHVRIYGQDYSKRLEEAGFRVKRINISKQFPKSGLNPDEDIFIGEKL